MGRTVTVIPAKRSIGNTAKKEKSPKLRVAAYCRVSTDSDEQATSYEAQVEHYTEYIKKNPKWEFAGIFADDGISGTATKRRDGFNHMIDECLAGRIDMVITKSISRFARNTLDCLKFIRMLKEKNIPVYFEKENINTMEASGELLITIMASLAQQESQSLSQNVKLGLQYRYQQGHVQVNHTRFLGYTKDEKGQLVIEPSEAVVIRRIYREYLEGSSLQQICRGLEADGILTGAGKAKWRTETVQKILQNEKYIGDALLQKTYTVDFLNKTRVVNNGIMPQYYVENNHEAIIPRDIYMRVQEEMARRVNLPRGRNGKRRVYSAKYALSGNVFCGRCGDIYRRTQRNICGKKHTVWRCCNRIENGPGACSADAVKEKDLHRVVLQAINRIVTGKEEIRDSLLDSLTECLTGKESMTEEEIDARLADLQRKLIQAAGAGEDYDNIREEILRLRTMKQEALADDAEREGVKERISEMKQFLDEQEDLVREYDEKLVRQLVEKVTIYDDHYTIDFRSHASVDIHK